MVSPPRERPRASRPSRSSRVRLARVEQRHARRLLAELSRSHLLTRRAGDRYEFHDLLRAYARERAHTDDTGQERIAALQRPLDHYVYTTCATNRSVAPHRSLLTLQDTDTAPFRRGFTLNWLGAAYLRAGCIDEAVRFYRQAVEHRRSIGHRWGEATSLDGLGAALYANGDAESARQAWEQALTTYDELGHPDAEIVRAHLDTLDIEAWRMDQLFPSPDRHP